MLAGVIEEIFVGFFEGSCQSVSSVNKPGSSSSSPSAEIGLIRSVRLNSAQGSKSLEQNELIIQWKMPSCMI